MDTKQQNTLLVGAVLAGLLSLPMTWLTIHNVQPSFGNGLGGLFSSEFPRMSLDVNGLNGHLTLLIKSPIWFVVAIAIGASVLQLMKHSKAFADPFDCGVDCGSGRRHLDGGSSYSHGVYRQGNVGDRLGSGIRIRRHPAGLSLRSNS